MLRDYVWFKFETVLKVIARKPLEVIQVRFHNFTEKCISTKLSSKFGKMNGKIVQKSGFEFFPSRDWAYLKILGFQPNFQEFFKSSGFSGSFFLNLDFLGIFENLGISGNFRNSRIFFGNFRKYLDFPRIFEDLGIVAEFPGISENLGIVSNLFGIFWKFLKISGFFGYF